jgi:putative oxidoreductase
MFMNSQNNRFDITLLLIRLSVGIVIAGHGAQKLFGWFGGFGFDGTMGFFTGAIGLPYLLALLIVLLESLGMVALIAGLGSRVISAGVILIMLGAVVTTHGAHGFFMNWFGTQQGEGFEYHILVIALSLVLLLNGSGAYSLDHFLSTKVFSKTKTKSALV